MCIYSYSYIQPYIHTYSCSFIYLCKHVISFNSRFLDEPGCWSSTADAAAVCSGAASGMRWHLTACGVNGWRETVGGQSCEWASGWPRTYVALILLWRDRAATQPKIWSTLLKRTWSAWVLSEFMPAEFFMWVPRGARWKAMREKNLQE